MHFFLTKLDSQASGNQVSQIPLSLVISTLDIQQESGIDLPPALGTKWHM